MIGAQDDSAAVTLRTLKTGSFNGMDVTAKLRFLRMSPRKVRLVADMVRGKDVDQALALLQFDPHHAAHPLSKLIESAIANARHNYKLDSRNLFISMIRVDMGPTLKRSSPRAFGRAATIRRRTSHVMVVLVERIESQKSKVKSQKYGAPPNGT